MKCTCIQHLYTNLNGNPKTSWASNNAQLPNKQEPFGKGDDDDNINSNNNYKRESRKQVFNAGGKINGKPEVVADAPTELTRPRSLARHWPPLYQFSHWGVVHALYHDWGIISNFGNHLDQWWPTRKKLIVAVHIFIRDWMLPM